MTTKLTEDEVKTSLEDAPEWTEVSEAIQRLAHGALADTELLGQARFCGQQVARAPVAAGQALDQQFLDLRIERPESGRLRHAAHR